MFADDKMILIDERLFDSIEYKISSLLMLKEQNGDL